MARSLADIALDGAESLGPDYLSADDVRTATEFFDKIIPTN
jgi:hypothetical protein